MRRRSLIVVGLVALVVAGGGLYLALRPQGDSPDAGGSTQQLEAQRITVAEVDVTIEPRQFNDDGAAFAITLDTHSVELDADMTQATLEVNGTAWPVADWSGDGPGGHHRQGELRFSSAGQATGAAILTLAGLPEPVEARWELTG